MTTAPSPISAIPFVGSYEHLRARALLGSTEGPNLGSAVLQRHGIAGWMARSGDDAHLPDPRRVVRRAPPNDAAVPVGSEFDVGLVRAIADMTLVLTDNLRETAT